MATFGQIVENVKHITGRGSSKRFEQILSDTLMDKINELCRAYSFWFLRVDPDPSVFQYLYTNGPVTISDLGTDDFFAAGWMKTTSGRVNYTVRSPLFGMKSFDTDLEDVVVPVLQQISKINYVRRRGTSGELMETLQTCSPEMLSAAANYNSGSQPTHITFFDRSRYSEIQVYPVPQDEYIYEVSYQLASLPAPVNASSTNPFFENFPEVTKYLGLSIAGEFFKDKELVELAHLYLYGPPTMPQAGALHRIGKANMKRHEGPDPTLLIHKSQQVAIGYPHRNQHPTSDGAYYENRW